MNDGGPAFHSITCRSGDNYNPEVLIYHRGMSLRDWFAGQALMGSAANPQLLKNMEETGIPAEAAPAFLAERSYVIADAMLAARDMRNL